MSLINKMLRDLEDRDAFLASPQDGVISDLRSAQDFAQMTSRKGHRLNILLLGLVLLVVALFALNQYRRNAPVQVAPPNNVGGASPVKKISRSPHRHVRPAPEHTITPPVATVKGAQNPALSLKLDAKPLQVPSNGGANPAPVADVHPALLAVQQQSGGSGGRIDMRFSSPPHYSIYILENPERLLVVLPGASIPPDGFAQFRPAGMISGVRYAKEGDSNRVIFDMTGPIVMQSAGVSAGTGGIFDFRIRYAAADAATTANTGAASGTALAAAASAAADTTGAAPPGTHADVAASNEGISSAASAKAGNVIKAAVTPAPVPAPEPVSAPARESAGDDTAAMVNVKQQSSENDRAQRLYRQGVENFYKGKYARAISALQGVLQISPTYLEARQLLVSILLNQGDRKDAAHLLEQGLEYHPDDPTLIKMNARMLYQDGELQHAMQMLAHIKPQLQDDPEYYALLAAILQKGRDYTRAGEIYQKLVNFNPGNGVWWAGLGISLDGVGRGAQALQAFKKAAADPSIPSGLRDYLSTRIKALAKSPA